MTLLAGVLTFAWPFATTEASLIIIASIYSFCIGPFLALLAAPVIAFGEVKDVDRRVGVSMSVISIAALAGPPISGAINDKSEGFAAVGYYADTIIDYVTLFRIIQFSVSSRFRLA